VARDEVTQVLQDHFRPEFLNRIDEIVIFHSLGREHLAGIVDIQLKRVSHLLADKGYNLDVSDEARKYLAEEGGTIRVDSGKDELLFSVGEPFVEEEE
jgi:ATP-dependent Clp protease ATP-binding subunit ClpB